MALKPGEAEDDLVSWCTGDEEENVLLMYGLHGEGEWFGYVCDGSGS